MGFFVCSDVTAGTEYFDETSITNAHPLSNLDTPRYRHSATFVPGVEAPSGQKGTICVFGGRDVFDNLNYDVECLDPEDGTWWTVGIWDQATSDNAAFTAHDIFSDFEGSVDDDSSAFLVGGYDQYYNTLNTVTIFHPKLLSNENGTLKTRSGKSMIYPRGDFSIIGQVDQMEYSPGRVDRALRQNGSSGRKLQQVHMGDEFAYRYFYAVSGFSTDFCNPLKTTEFYDILTGSWTRSADLIDGRGDFASTSVDNIPVTIGGEVKNNCSVTVSVDVDGDEIPISIPDGLIESFLGDTQFGYQMGETWTDTGKVDIHRMRFSAATLGLGIDSPTYIFGGQIEYDPISKTFNISDEIFLLTASYKDDNGDDGGDDGGNGQTSPGSTLAKSCTFYDVFKHFALGALVLDLCHFLF